MNACVQQIIKERIVSIVVSQSCILSTSVLPLILHGFGFSLTSHLNFGLLGIELGR